MISYDTDDADFNLNEGTRMVCDYCMSWALSDLNVSARVSPNDVFQ